MLMILQLLAQWIIDNDVRIGGKNKVVEIDETKVGRRKYQQDNGYSEELIEKLKNVLFYRLKI